MTSRPSTENLGEGLVILPSPTLSGPAEGVSGHLSTPQCEPVVLYDGVGVWVEGASLGSPGTERSSATGSASSLPALRNDSGEAVWRLTEKALEHFESCRVRLGQEAFRIELGQSRGSAECASVGTGEASCD